MGKVKRRKKFRAVPYLSPGESVLKMWKSDRDDADADDAEGLEEGGQDFSPPVPSPPLFTTRESSPHAPH